MPYDKKLHLLCGFIIGGVGCLTGVPFAGVSLAVLAGAGKELYDYMHQDKHTVDFWDFVYTAGGGAVAQVVFELLF